MVVLMTIGSYHIGRCVFMSSLWKRPIWTNKYHFWVHFDVSFVILSSASTVAFDLLVPEGACRSRGLQRYTAVQVPVNVCAHSLYLRYLSTKFSSV